MSRKLYVQIGYSREETWAARIYADSFGLCHLEDIPKLPKSGWTPVGTVEFCRAAMAHQGIPEPEPLDYPECLVSFAAAGHRLRTFGDLPADWTPETPHGIHAKPYKTKLPESQWKPDTPFWIGNWHRFLAEFRVYVCHGKILGVGRYDDRDDDPEDLPELDMGLVQEMVLLYQRHDAPAGYSLDVGVSDKDGMTKLIEVSDGWALGLYKNSCSPRAFLRLLEARWQEIAQQTKGQANAI